VRIFKLLSGEFRPETQQEPQVEMPGKARIGIQVIRANGQVEEMGWFNAETEEEEG
jgi:hypothetical protein